MGHAYTSSNRNFQVGWNFEIYIQNKTEKAADISGVSINPFRSQGNAQAAETESMTFLSRDQSKQGAVESTVSKEERTPDSTI